VKPSGIVTPDGAAPHGLDLVRHARGAEARVLVSGIGLIAGRVASMGLGFIAWLVAARLYPPSEVGVASGLVAAMMLCVQIALFGIGSAAIATYTHHQGAPSRLLNSGATAVIATSAAIGLGFLGVAAVAFDELRVAITPSYAVAFLAMTVFGTLNTFYDHASIALHRGEQVLVRNAAFGLISILGILSIPQLVDVSGSLAIVASWAAAGVAACVLAVVQLRRRVPSFRPRVAIDLPLARELVNTGVPNWLLTLTERAPALILPILVTELLSPTTNAFWYAVWMMGWVVLIVPISIGQTLFAEVTQRPRAIASAVARAVRSSLALGVVAAIGLAILAEFALGLLGEAYAAAGALPLRVLVLAVVPFTLTQAYYAVCRARGALGEAVVMGTIVGVAALGITLAGGILGGLLGMAIGWLCVHALAGLWAALRIRSLVAGQPIEATAAA
jgi:O-antigen/teichoic acid export membrane protein